MFKLTPEAQEVYQKAREYGLNQRETFASMSDENLASSARFWMQHCKSPGEFTPEEPIYDSTFWHAIVPEMIKRLEKKSRCGPVR